MRPAFPGGKRFAFTVIDDTDVATVENVAPLYRLLESLGMRTTKTVWPVACPEGSRKFAGSATLEDAPYREFVRDLERRGFEITWHGPTMESSMRDRIVVALERYREVFGRYPRIHVNHSHNTDNVYWGADRFDSPMLRAFVTHVLKRPPEFSQGHQQGSRYWWGDLCQQHIEYCRNLTTSYINTERYNPSMPYRDPARPLIPWWFSASDAETVHEFNELISSKNQDTLEREGGFCIVATHFGKGFVTNGAVHAETRARLEELTRRSGWFPTTGELLDWLRSQRGGTGALPSAEWRRMQWRWATDLMLRKLRSGLLGRTRADGM